jgi:hypothetical protein
MQDLRQRPLAMKTGYRYKGWSTGKTWACHVSGPYCWERAYGFENERAAHWWALEWIEGQSQADATRGAHQP